MSPGGPTEADSNCSHVQPDVATNMISASASRTGLPVHADGETEVVVVDEIAVVQDSAVVRWPTILRHLKAPFSCWFQDQ